MGPPSNNRIVLLFDLDCFYAQCERVRLGLDKDCSLALLQWNSTLAVTYPAREYGIKRGDSWDAVKQKSKSKCHAIHLHILESTETEQDVELQAQDEDLKTAFETIYTLSPEERTIARKQLGVRRHHYEGKACLERYRLASMRIFSVVLESLTKHLKGKDKFVLERASIDEFYLDISKYCFRSHEEDTAGKHSSINDDATSSISTGATGITNAGIPNQKPTVVVGESSTQDEDEEESPLTSALHRACQVSEWIRTDVWNSLGFTMSAGISTNKMMAKLAAGYGKPNGQALLHPDNFETVMATTKIRKVRNFGGKLGKGVIQKLLNGKEDATMGDLAQVPLPVLLRHFSQETALFVFDSCRGNDSEAVKETTGALVKSITAFKSFTATKQTGEIEKWLNIISNEIVTRVGKDTFRNRRYPKTCTLNYTYYTTPNGRRPMDGTHRSQRNTRSVRLQYPAEAASQKAALLQEQAMKKLLPILAQHPLRGVGMSANNFETKGGAAGGTIQNFFVAGGKDSNGVGSSHRSAVTTMSLPTSKPGVGKYFAKTDASSAKEEPRDNGPRESAHLKCSNSNAEKRNTEKSDWELAKELQASFSKENDTQSVGLNHPGSQNAILQKPETVAITVDKDMELARKLQATYDRENYVLTAGSRRPSTRGPAKKKVRRIDTFFQRR